MRNFTVTKGEALVNKIHARISFKENFNNEDGYAVRVKTVYEYNNKAEDSQNLHQKVQAILDDKTRYSYLEGNSVGGSYNVYAYAKFKDIEQAVAVARINRQSEIITPDGVIKRLE